MRRSTSHYDSLSLFLIFLSLVSCGERPASIKDDQSDPENTVDEFAAITEAH